MHITLGQWLNIETLFVKLDEKLDSGMNQKEINEEFVRLMELELLQRCLIQRVLNN